MSSFDALDVEHGGLLSDATLSALQLRQQPFTATAADGDTFSDDTTAEQLGDIKQALINGDDLLLILGEDGAGKSTLLSQLGANSGMRIQCFSVKGSQRFSTTNLFAGMLEAFKEKPAADLKSMLDQLIPCLQSMVAGNTLSAIVLDDADKVGEAELTRLLSGMLYVNSQDETLMRIALAAPGAFEDHIPDLLPEGADLPYSSLTIDRLNAERASSYLDFRLNQAGHFEAFPFTDKEISTMVEQSDGLPSELHAAAADMLNERHGAYEEIIPPELLTQGGGVTAGKSGKLILGALAGALIIGGLVLFKKPNTEADDNRYRVVEQRKIDGNANQISLVNEDADSTNSTDTSASGDSGSSDASTATNTSSSSDDSDASGDNNNSEASNSGTSTASSSSADADSSNNDASTADADSAANQAATDATTSNENATSNQDSATSTSNDSGGAASDGNTDTDATGSNAEATSADASTESAAQDNPEQVPQVPTSNNNEGEAVAAVESNDSDALAETSTDSDTSDPTSSVLESPNWVLTQDAKLFTVQMSASTEREVVEKFLSVNPLDPPNSIFSFDRNGTTWYALVHGLYPSIAAARTAVERMPASAQTNQPWIRAVGRIQKALKEQN